MKIKAFVNINGESLPVTSGTELLSWLLQLIDPQSPFTVLRENVLKAIEIAVEVDRRKTRMAGYVGRLETKEKLFEFCYNNILNAEGMPLLFGFSVQVPIGKGDTGYNPERRRMSTKHADDE